MSMPAIAAARYIALVFITLGLIWTTSRYNCHRLTNETFENNEARRLAIMVSVIIIAPLLQLLVTYF